MKKRCKVEVVKAVTITYSGTPRIYRSPVQAARQWAEYTTRQWIKKKFAHLSWNQLQTHHSQQIEDQKRRYYQKSYPIFKRLLA